MKHIVCTLFVTFAVFAQVSTFSQSQYYDLPDASFNHHDRYAVQYRLIRDWKFVASQATGEADVYYDTNFAGDQDYHRTNIPSYFRRVWIQARYKQIQNDANGQYDTADFLTYFDCHHQMVNLSDTAYFINGSQTNYVVGELNNNWIRATGLFAILNPIICANVN